MLEAAPLSLTRRGTHALKRNGETLYFVESSAVNLRIYEGDEVTLDGSLEANTEKDALPVLVVTRVLKSTNEDVRSWSMPDLQLTFSVPSDWKGQITGDTARFREEGVTFPRLQVFVRDQAMLPFEFSSIKLRDGTAGLSLTPVVIDGRRGARIENKDEKTVQIFMERIIRTTTTLDVARTQAIVFSFSSGDESKIDPLMMEHILDSIQFTAGSDRSTAGSGSSISDDGMMQGSGSMLGKPCGGPAGILCPSGFYCEVTDPAIDIGSCRRL
jgi:hypothetical protein